MTSATGGYVTQNMFNVLQDDNVDDTDSVSTGNSIIQAAANATVNSLRPIGANMRQIIFDLRKKLISPPIFVP
jgi:hypothetical protein